jgi:hypothetical protein
MTTPAGTISLSNVQTEFGGVNPIGMNEYYNGGLYITPNNTLVPTSGTISMSQFRNLYRASTPAELITAVGSTPYADYRNALFSYITADLGFETSTAAAYHAITYFNLAGSVTSNLTYRSTYVSGAQPFLKTSYITFVCLTAGVSASYASLTVGGVARTMTSLGATSGTGGTAAINYTQVAVGENALAGLSVTGNYTKSGTNRTSQFNIIALPGKWDYVTSIQTGDFMCSISTAGFDVNPNGSSSFSPAYTTLARRSSQWYNNTESLVGIATASGSFVAGYGSNSVSSGGDNPTTTVYPRVGVAAAFRCVQG